MLIGGGSGGHITPLLAVASELKQSGECQEIIAVCEKGSKFAYLYQESKDIDQLFQIPAGKYRRYSNDSFLHKLLDIKTNILNIRDIFITIYGYFQARKLLKAQKPDAILFKGGFVAVPVGFAASRLRIPFITHDSDSTPGLANKIISKWAKYNAIGMPAELYDYPQEKIKYVGIPLSSQFQKVTEALKSEYRNSLSLRSSDRVISVVGGSLGAKSLNEDIIKLSKTLVEKYPDLKIIHIAGHVDEQNTINGYKAILGDEQFSKHIKVYGFVNNVYEIQGAADLVITRAGATQTAELATQGLPIIIIPANLAGAHQEKNARMFDSKEAALVVGNGRPDDLQEAIIDLLNNDTKRSKLSRNLSNMASPHASTDLVKLVLSLANPEN